MNFRKVNIHLSLLVTLAVAIIAIICSSAVVNTADVFSDNATMTADVTVTGGGNGDGDSTGGGGGGSSGGGSGGITSVYDVVTGSGRFLSDVTAESSDGNVILYIPKDTIGLNRNGYPLITIGIKEKEPMPPPPENAEIVGLVYEMTPGGSTLTPPAVLTVRYSENEIPQGVTEKNLVIASYDSQSEEWQNLESTVDIENNTVTVSLDIFSIYSILAYTRPASFEVTDFSIDPERAGIGEIISISVLVTNTGDLAGSYVAELRINDIAGETREITLDGGDSQTISFSVIPDDAGEYIIRIGDLYGWLEVREPVSEGVVAEVPAPEPPAPAPKPAPEPERVGPFTVPELPEFPGVGQDFSWRPILMIFGGMLVVICVLVFLLKRYG